MVKTSLFQIKQNKQRACTIILRNFRPKLNYILTILKNQNIATVDQPEKEWTFQLGRA